ncbi:hypothetical protein Q3G72_007029 [Acer saccharum]|nr:hypothetical protein Q3G72_007029 [Acer saccharum]
MAAVVCTQCGAEAPHSTGEGALNPPVRCRFCGHTYGAAAPNSTPPQAAARAVIGSPPPRRTQPPMPSAAPAPVRAGIDPLSLPFDAQDAAPRPQAGPKRWPLVLGLGLVLGLTGAVLKPVQMGLSPDWYASMLGKHVDPVAQQELQQGLAALNRGSSRGLIEAKQSFERALKIDGHYAQALAGLAEAELGMAQALGDAAQDMAHFSQGLSRKEMHRAQHDAQTQRQEAKLWTITATPAAQTAVQWAPNTPAANRVMAELLRQQGDMKGALAWAQGGRTSVSEDAGMMVVQADLIAEHDAAGACALLERALQKAPTDNRARYRLAQYLLKKKDAAHALQAVNAILAAAPEHELAQQMLMRLQPAASQAEKVQRPLVLSFESERQSGSAPQAQMLANADAGAAAPQALAPPAGTGASDTAEMGDESPSQGPPMTFLAQAKLSAQNVWQSLGSLFSSSDVPEPVAPSDLGGGMPIPSGPAASASEPEVDPAPQNDNMAAAAPPLAAIPKPLPLPSIAPVDKAVQAAAKAPVAAAMAPSAAKPVAAVALSELGADVQRLGPTELLQRADAQRSAHNPAQALPLYQLAARRAPQQMGALLGVGYTQLDLGAPAAAADAFNEALRLSSWQAEPHFGLAQALQAGHNNREAIAHYRRYLAIEPGGPHAAIARQMLEELSK